MELYSKNSIFIFIFYLIALMPFSLELRDLRVIESEEELLQEEQKIIQPPGFSRISGFYPNNFKLKLLSEESTTIYYTVDSSDPKTSNTSKEFTDGILIYDRS